MTVERRERAIAIWLGSTGNGRNPMFNGRRQPSRGGTSRMTRECQVRFCEGLGVKFPGPTRQNQKNSDRAYVFRFSSESGLCSMQSACLKGAIKRLMHPNKQHLYSITSSAQASI